MYVIITITSSWTWPKIVKQVQEHTLLLGLRMLDDLSCYIYCPRYLTRLANNVILEPRGKVRCKTLGLREALQIKQDKTL